jgi:hypothetical protein
MVIRGGLDPRFYWAVAKLAAAQWGYADPFVKDKPGIDERRRAVIDCAEALWGLRSDGCLTGWAWRRSARVLAAADPAFASLAQATALSSVTQSATGTAARWAHAVGALGTRDLCLLEADKLFRDAKRPRLRSK